MDDVADQSLSQSKLMRVRTQKKGKHTIFVCYHFYYNFIHTEAKVEEKVSWNYYELFQMVLQAQADAIVKLGFNPIVKVPNNRTLLNVLFFQYRIVFEPCGFIF